MRKQSLYINRQSGIIMENTKIYERLFFEKSVSDGEINNHKEQGKNELESLNGLCQKINALSLGWKSDSHGEIQYPDNLDAFLSRIAVRNIIESPDNIVAQIWEYNSQMILNFYNIEDNTLSTRLIAQHGKFDVDLVHDLQRFYKIDGEYDLFRGPKQ